MSATERQDNINLLKKDLETARVQHRAAVAAQQAAQRQTSEAEKQINSLVSRISRLEEEAGEQMVGKLTVTDHAVVRWLERKHGLNIDSVRQEILDNGTASAIKFIGTGKVVKDGLTLVIKDRVVITVAPMNKGAITL